MCVCFPDRKAKEYTLQPAFSCPLNQPPRCANCKQKPAQKRATVTSQGSNHHIAATSPCLGCRWAWGSSRPQKPVLSIVGGVLSKRIPAESTISSASSAVPTSGNHCANYQKNTNHSPTWVSCHKKPAFPAETIDDVFPNKPAGVCRRLSTSTPPQIPPNPPK